MTAKKTIVIVDDHALFREGLKGIIRRQPAYDLVGETGRADEALRMAKACKPDLMLVDIALPDQSGIELTRLIRRCIRGTAVMIVSMHSKVDYIVRAFQAGATGYVTKDSAPERLLLGMETVLSGEYFMDSAVSEKVVRRLAGLRTQQQTLTDNRYAALTPRQQEILGLLAEGLSMTGIGERLFISPKTVENHRTSIMKKLGVHSTFELIRYAAKIGIVDVDLWKD
jgi:DNA-binding NarL/FixJ family response regulator